MTDWAYPDTFKTIGAGAQWVSVIGVVACIGLLISWAVLPVEKTFRHYLSICLTTAVLFMSVRNVRSVSGLLAARELTFLDSSASLSPSQRSQTNATIRLRLTRCIQARCVLRQAPSSSLEDGLE